ncbi:porin [Paludisphaera sp.]|uniref:porin n=1 Tax=Paludisphaera sp. TaxID=2017432 RepID=UPI00301DD3D3
MLWIAIYGCRPAASQTPPPAPPPNAPTAADSDLETRLRRLEELNERILRENAELRENVRALTERVAQGPPEPGASSDGDPAGDVPGLASGPNVDPELNPDGSDSSGFPPSRPGGDPRVPLSSGATTGAVPGLASGPNVDPELNPDGSDSSGLPPSRPGRERKRQLFGDFSKGFVFDTDDEEFVLRFNNETQVESRLFEQSGQTLAHDQIAIPRQIWAFSGRITKPLEYMASFNKGFGDFNLRDAYINFNFDKRLMFRLGRYRVPYTYEFYAESNVELLAPERSVYAINYGLNRQIGYMAWGELLSDRMEYAVGMFNGPRNGFEDFHDGVDLIAYLNVRPFQESKRFPFLNHLNIGGSVASGEQRNDIQPRFLRTSVNASNSEGAATSSVPFLAFNEGVSEAGDRALWSVHAAYFYKGLSLLAELDGGHSTYGWSDRDLQTRVPVGGYYVQAGYLLTGETLEKRTVIDPIRPFSLKRGEFGLGALEAHARYAAIHLGDEVFLEGLSDPNLWTNKAGVIDTGLNWYPNRYLKIYLDWQHSMFGQPVFYRPGGLQKTSDLFWLRFQLNF